MERDLILPGSKGLEVWEVEKFGGREPEKKRSEDTW
jgi:hypothetical protein